MILICARSRDRVDYASGGAPEFRRVGVSEDLELQHCFDSQQHASYRSGCFVVHVINVSAIQQKTALLRTRPIDRDFRCAAAYWAVTCGRDRIDARFEQG